MNKYSAYEAVGGWVVVDDQGHWNPVLHFMESDAKRLARAMKARAKAEENKNG